MKKNLLNIMLVAALLSATACQNTENDSSGNHELAQDMEGQETTMFHTDSTTSDSGNEGTGGGAGNNMSTPAFARAVAESSMLEVQLGQLAQQNASNVEVRQFGSMMVKAHSALNQELKELAEGNGVDLPTSLAPQGMNKYTELSKLKGIQFDQAYAQLMVDSHQKTMQMLMDYSENTGPGTVDGSPSVTGTPKGGNTAGGSGTSTGNTGTAGNNNTGTGNTGTAGNKNAGTGAGGTGTAGNNNGAATAGNAGGTDSKNRQPTVAGNDFRSWAVKNIPTMQMHLEEAQKLKQAVTTNITRKGDELTSERPSNAQQNNTKRQK